MKPTLTLLTALLLAPLAVLHAADLWEMSEVRKLPFDVEQAAAPRKAPLVSFGGGDWMNTGDARVAKKKDELPLPPDVASEPTAPKGASPLDLRRNLDLYADRSFTAAEARAALHAYYACVSYTDAQIGRVLDALDASGEAGHTIIVLWGDHGWHLSEKGMFAQGTLFEVATRAPLIIADPRLISAAGKTSRRIVQFVDIYPTLADLCSLPLPKGLEGASLKPLLENSEAEWSRPPFTVPSRGWSIGRRLRTERWAYSEWDEGRSGKALFDHDNDPHEMRNLASEPAHQDTVAQLQQQLRESKVGQSMRNTTP